MTEQLLCPRCRRGTQDGLLCESCVGVFERAVGDLARLEQDLAVVVARLDETSKAIRHVAVNVAPSLDRVVRPLEVDLTPARLRALTEVGALSAHGVPVNLDAADLQRKLRAAIVRWAEALCPVRRPLLGPACEHWMVCVHDSCAVLWAQRRAQQLAAAPPLVRLLGATRALRRHPSAVECVDELSRFARSVERVVDNREADLFAGPCDAPDVKLHGEVITPGICGVDLYARLGDRWVVCSACGARYSYAARREWLLDAVREVWARPALIARALAAWDLDLTQARLDQWISRDRRRHRACWPGAECGHIVQVGLDSDEVDEEGRPLGRPLYRVGDVLDRVDAMRAKKRADEGVTDGRR